MREGWTYKKLGEVCEVVMGQSPDGDSINEKEGTEFHQGKTCFGDRFLTHSHLYTSKPAKYAEANSVLLCVRAPVGFPNITQRRICIGRGLCSLSCKKEITNMFLYYSLLGKQAYFEKNSTGSTFKAISSKIVSNTTIPIPSLSEQQAIVSELDKINELISLKKAQLSDLDALAQSIFYDMFGDPIENEKGWEVKKFGEVYKLKSGDGLSSKNFEDGPYSVFGGNGISGTHKTYNMDGEYIIIGRVGVYCGNVRYVKGKFWLTDNAFQLIYDKSKQIHIFIKHLLSIMDLHQYANQAAQPVISNITLKNVNVVFPPLSLQQDFAKRIELIEQQKAQISSTIKDLETLLASRMQYWFD